MGQAHKAKWVAAALLSAYPTGAIAETAMYRCLVEGGKYDFKLVNGEWHERRPAETMEWTSLECGATVELEGKTYPKVTCGKEGDESFAVTGTSLGARAQILDPVKLRYSFHHNLKYEGDTRPPADMAGDCAVLESDEARPIAAWPLSKKLANGLPFVLATKRDGLKLRPGDWEYPNARYFLTFDGKYHPLGGTWALGAIGFDPHRVNSFHTCPPYNLRPKNAPICGGIHQEGHQMDRWHKPEDHELAAFGYAYTFDEAGTVYYEGKPVAKLMVPDL